MKRVSGCLDTRLRRACTMRLRMEGGRQAAAQQSTFAPSISLRLYLFLPRYFACDQSQKTFFPACQVSSFFSHVFLDLERKTVIAYFDDYELDIRRQLCFSSPPFLPITMRSFESSSVTVIVNHPWLCALLTKLNHLSLLRFVIELSMHFAGTKDPLIPSDGSRDPRKYIRKNVHFSLWIRSLDSGEASLVLRKTKTKQEDFIFSAESKFWNEAAICFRYRL